MGKKIVVQILSKINKMSIKLQHNIHSILLKSPLLLVIVSNFLEKVKIPTMQQENLEKHSQNDRNKKCRKD